MSPENLSATPKQDGLLETLQHLLELSATDVAETLHQTAQFVTQALGAEKVDVFLYDPSTECLIAYGTSVTPTGNKEKAIGLDCLPLANGGREVEVYLTGQPYWTGQAHRDPKMLQGMKEDLNIKSEMLVPFDVNAERRGILLVSSRASDAFNEHDLHFLEAVTHWVGVVTHRAELVEQHTNEATEQAKRFAAEEMLTVMAHDLRNYLTPLKGRLDLLERRARREEQEVYMRELVIINQTVMRLNSLVSGLLEVERLKQDVFSLHRQQIDLVELIEEVVPIWSTPGHAIHIQAPDKLIITADRDRLQQVVENLLSNATTHADPDAPVQVVVAQEQRMDGPWAIVMISNQGPAMSSEQLTSLFLPFAKGAHSRGLGLGLYVAQRIAHAHQGMLTAQTEAGKATQFTLALPLKIIEPSFIRE